MRRCDKDRLRHITGDCGCHHGRVRPYQHPGTRRWVVALAGSALIAGCGAPTPPVNPSPVPTSAVSTATVPSPTATPATNLSPTPSEAPAIVLPPAGAGFDYQLGGAYPPPSGVRVVVRDRSERPAPGVYSICYLNGFQTQPDEQRFWLTRHPDLLLRTANGVPVVDADWGELLLDTGTEPRRSAIAGIVGQWISGCAEAGFAAVEFDNLDSYDRSQGVLTRGDNVAMQRQFSRLAHAQGLAVAQKNAAELLGRRSELGTDFAIAEECTRYAECAEFVAVYGRRVYVIEYRDSDFAAGCRRSPELSIIRRDLDLVPAGSAGYVYRSC